MEIHLDGLLIPVRYHPRRRHLALVVTDTGVEVRVPPDCPPALIRRFVTARAGWIRQKRQQLRQRRFHLWGEPQPAAPDPADARALLAPWLAARLDHWALKIAVRPAAVRIRPMCSRWGSCSSRGNLSFSLSLVQLPQDVADYVVVHELAHLRHMNHSPAFWREVARMMPDFEQKRAQLRLWGRKIAFLQGF